MMKVRASAPGKVVLLGEYAVLFGAPALVMAVDRCAKVEILPSESSGIEVWAPEVWPEAVRFDVLESGAVEMRSRVALNKSADRDAAFALVVEVLAGLWREGLVPARLACAIRIDTSALFDQRATGRAKLGLGSSAALTVALASALAMFFGQASRLDDKPGWHQLLFRLHRRFQGGKGSGVDIAASLHGGTLRYRLEGDEPQVQPASWPPALLRSMVWTGTSASTPSFLGQLEAWRRLSPEISQFHLDRLIAAAVRGADAAASGVGAGELLQCCRAFTEALQQFSAASKIRIFSADHQRILTSVVNAGGFYKPCGAGGGDLGMALTLNPELQRRLEQELDVSGFPILKLAEQSSGLRCQRVPAGDPFEDD